jgi:hypothetical protein
MISFPAFARDFELYPTDGRAYQHLYPLLSRLSRVEFSLSVPNPLANQGQLKSDLDISLEKAIVDSGAERFELQLPPSIRGQLDFAFTINGHKVAVEIEKANIEKILRDILKCHKYLHFGADYCIIILQKNYPHTHSVWNLYRRGIEHLQDCNTYSFGVREKLDRILLMGFESCSADTNEPHSIQTRKVMRATAVPGFGKGDAFSTLTSA